MGYHGLLRFLILCEELEHYVDIDVIDSIPKLSIEQVVAKMFDFKSRNRSRQHWHENFNILKIESCCVKTEITLIEKRQKGRTVQYKYYRCSKYFGIPSYMFFIVL
jgi:hypothetical protein